MKPLTIAVVIIIGIPALFVIELLGKFKGSVDVTIHTTALPGRSMCVVESVDSNKRWIDAARFIGRCSDYKDGARGTLRFGKGRITSIVRYNLKMK